MANSIQKLLLALSTASPVMICIGIVYLIQYENIFASILLIVFGILFSAYNFLMIFICKLKMSVTPIVISELSANDNWNVLYFLTYIVPFANLVLKDFNVYFSIVIAVLIALFLFFSNVSFSNPLLLVFGYHSFRIMDEGGTNDCILISKRKHVKPKSIKYVYIVFDYYLVEKES